jgi:hypothetical protein
MVDSSKTAWRSAVTPFQLRRKLKQNLQLVHIVRDPRGVCWSLLKKAERGGIQGHAMVRCCRAIIGWWVANMACEIFGWAYPEQYKRIRYEDLARSPREVMTGLFQKLLPGAAWRAEEIGMIENRHQLQGNRMRSQPLSFEDIKEDDEWRVAAPARHQYLIARLSGVLLSRYGYNQAQTLASAQSCSIKTGSVEDSNLSF